MVIFRLPSILHRKRRAETTGGASVLTDRDDAQQSSQPISRSLLSADTPKPSWASRYLSSAFSGQTRTANVTAGLPPSPSTATATATATAKIVYNTSRDNNIYRLPSSVKRQLPEAPIRTPTRNTDTPLPTIIHPSTPLPSSPSPLCSSSPSSPNLKQNPHSGANAAPPKPILKAPETGDGKVSTQPNQRHTAESDTAANTSRNALLTLNEIPVPERISSRQSTSMHLRRNSIPYTTSGHVSGDAGLGNNDLITQVPSGNQKSKFHEDLEGKMKAKETGQHDGDGGGAEQSSGEANGEGYPMRSKKRKAVRFDHVDIHTYEVERDGESALSFLSKPFGGDASGKQGEDLDGDGILDLTEYVVDIPDVIEG
ncbi:hypothetical protein AJ79_04160 [Helicocarpus griseus UAMH5409]|uniref:EF-hand domain-containing protein n=1 Tax=Helicocarpus griseus UAMH5409 TaxID=1447875 RepID=A0A2B7XUI8_9EURO|nr:hypothetical protein AJ79_04160 [Helicocarpus griseus UAMH5409]